jgi:sulfatase maturation enzyme AslB (radical SAM superfamily)
MKNAKYLSCESIQNAVYLAPEEIRTCCKRFWHLDEFKGDVVIIPEIEDGVISSETIRKAKDNIILEINNNTNSPCSGCPWMHCKDWDKLNPRAIKFISLEHNTVCNFRCIYCDEVYYGGKKCQYNILKTLQSLKNAESYAGEIERISWGGGEPTLDSQFAKILQYLLKHFPSTLVTIFTNSSVFSQQIKDAIDEDKINIVTSIDAGSNAVFQKMRGADKLDAVIENVRVYSEINPINVTIKYIATELNIQHVELNKFVDRISAAKLFDVNIQISSNFKDDQVHCEVMRAVIYLYCLLKHNGFHRVHIDDLYMHRIRSSAKSDFSNLLLPLQENGMHRYIANLNPAFKEVIVYGAGAYSVDLLKNTFFFQQVKVAFFVDKNKHGGTHLGLPVKAPEDLLGADLPIVIAAVQSFSSIYKDLLKMGVPLDRIIDTLIL